MPEPVNFATTSRRTSSESTDAFPPNFADRLAEHAGLFEGGFMPLAFAPPAAPCHPVATPEPAVAVAADVRRAGKRPSAAALSSSVLAPSVKRQRPGGNAGDSLHLHAPAAGTHALSIAHLRDPATSATYKLCDTLLAHADLLARPRDEVIHLLRMANSGLCMNEAPVAYDTAVFEKTCEAHGARETINAAHVNDRISNHLSNLTEAGKVDFAAQIQSRYDLLLWLNRQGYAPTLQVVTRAMFDRGWQRPVFRLNQPLVLPRSAGTR